MNLLYSSRRNGSQILIKALAQPSSSAARPSTAAGGTFLPQTILGPADAHTHRRWSHYAASTRFEPSSGRHNSQTRAFSATANRNASDNDGSAPWPASPPLSSSLSRRPIQKAVAEVQDPNPIPPGAALKRAANALDILNAVPDLPPWQAASQERLSQELLEYRNDLASAKKSVAAARNSSDKRSLPFIGEAISSIVDAERAALASPYSNLYSSSSGGGGAANKKQNNNNQNISARSLNKLLGFAQLRAVLDMVPAQDGHRSSTSSQLYDQMWSDSHATNTTDSTAAAAGTGAERAREEIEKQQQIESFSSRQGKVKPVGGDEAQSILAAKANEVIGVLTAVEFLLPLAPWQRRLISRAVVESMHDYSDDEGGAFSGRKNKKIGAGSYIHKAAFLPTKPSKNSYNGITAHLARTAVSFLLTECGLTHRQAAHAIAEHPWLLSIENIRTRCSGLLESLHLLNMDAMAVASVVAAHPPALLMDADKDVIPLLEYLNGLGFHEDDAAELIRAAPTLLLDPIAKQRLSGCVAFWVGQGMSRSSLRSLLTAAPEVTSMSLRLLQLKIEWLMERAGFSIEDVSQVPAAVQLPLAAHVAPRLAFARHRGFTVDPPSKEQANPSFQKSLQIESVLSSPEVDFLLSVGNATDAEYRAFEAAWRDSDLRAWFKSRLSGLSVTQYEGMEWLAEEEMASLRQMHDHHVALREIAWEQQHDREKEWETIWGDWKRAQARRDQLETWTKRMKQRREDEAMRRATVEMTMLVESQGIRRPGMCLKSPYCNRKINHPGVCNQKLALKMNFNLDDDSTVGADGGGDNGDNVDASSGEGLSSVDNELFNSTLGGPLGPGGVRGQTVHDIATSSEVDAGLYLFGEIKSDVPASENDHEIMSPRLDLGDGMNDASLSPSSPSIVTTAAGNSEGYLILGDGPTITKEEIENQDIDQVLECFSGLEALLERAPHGVLSHRTVNAWADRQGYTRAVSTAAKGVLAATGTARVVVEPNFQYHKVVPKAWQLLNGTTTGGGSSSGNGASRLKQAPPRLTRSAANVAILSNLVIKMIDSLPDGMIQRKDLRSWAEVRWKGSSKLHLRAVVAGLLEQGLVVQRRRKGISSGPMEVAQVDLKKYLQGLSQQLSTGSLSLSGEGKINNNDYTNGDGSLSASTLSYRTTTSNSTSSSLNTSTATRTGTMNEIFTSRSFPDDYQTRSALIRRVRFTDDDWTRFENLPPHQVRSCANGMLELLRSMPGMSVPHRIISSWAAQQGYDKETLTAAKGVMFTEGSANVYVESKGGGVRGGSFMPQKMWVATAAHDSDSDSSSDASTEEEVEEVARTARNHQGVLPLHQILKTVHEARGGFMTKGELRIWAKEYMGQEWQGVGALNVSITTLIESGCLMQLGALPVLDGKKSKLLVAVDLRQYLDENAANSD
ncbi:hypothetical protein Ndes2526B_g06599 [Nannochloris sp. 'desiccata']|nr:hypothetical protein NADE_006452 [Chlorella desiccata (nom. nud.)]